MVGNQKELKQFFMKLFENRTVFCYFLEIKIRVMQACLLVRSKTGQPVTLNSREVLAEVITLSQKTKQPLKG
jgi:hypothetical protein